MGSSGHVGSVQRGNDELRRSLDIDLRCVVVVVAAVPDAVLFTLGAAAAPRAAMAADISVSVAERCVRCRRDRWPCDVEAAVAADIGQSVTLHAAAVVVVVEAAAVARFVLE